MNAARREAVGFDGGGGGPGGGQAGQLTALLSKSDGGVGLEEGAERRK